MITNTCRTLGVVNAVAGAAPSVPAHASAHANAASRAAKRTRRHMAARPAGVRGDEDGEGVERIESVLLWARDYGVRRARPSAGSGCLPACACRDHGRWPCPLQAALP